MPRLTKLTHETHEKIVAAVRAGNYIETAAAFAGISKVTLYNWLKAGARSKGGPKRRFHDAVHQALAAAEVRDVTLIGKAAEKSWQAAAWRRERMAPARWGRRLALEHSGPDGAALDLPELAGLTDDELAEYEAHRAALRRLAGKTRGGPR